MRVGPNIGKDSSAGGSEKCAVPVNTEVGKEDFTAPQSNDQEGIMGVHGVSDRANPSEVNMNEEHARCDGTRADE